VQCRVALAYRSLINYSELLDEGLFRVGLMRRCAEGKDVASRHVRAEFRRLCAISSNCQGTATQTSQVFRVLPSLPQGLVLLPFPQSEPFKLLSSLEILFRDSGVKVRFMLAFLLLWLQAYNLRNAGAVIHSHGLESCLATMINPTATEFRVSFMLSSMLSSCISMRQFSLVVLG